MKTSYFLIATVIAVVAALAGCQTPVPVALDANNLSDRPPAVSTTANFQWNYDISGDRAIRPIQVFSNGEKTWLQMSPAAAFPAIFVNDLPIPFSIEAPYLVIVGAPQRINLVSAQYRAIVSRRTSDAKAAPPMRSTGEASRIQTVPSSQIPKE